MTAFQFIDECKKIYEKDLKDEIARVYLEKLNRYTPTQLVEILNSVLEEVPRFPKISDIIAAGNRLGYAQRLQSSGTHRWEPTGCVYCGGSGRVAVFWKREFESRESGKIELLNMSHICPYHKSADRARRGEDIEIRSIFRCECPAGDAGTIERGIPRWSRDRSLRMERQWG